MNKFPYVVVFIPAFNEAGSITKIIERIKELYNDYQTQKFEIDIIVIDDGSDDNTSELAKRAGVKVVRHPYNCGLGASTRTGLQRAFEAGADIAVKIDADFQHDPQDILKVIEPIINDQAEVVFGSRFSGKITYNMPFHRKIGNTFFTYLVRKLTGLNITDAQTGLMAFSRRYLANFNIISDYNETQQLIIDAWNKHMRVIEVPVIFHPRITGKSFISFKYPFKVLPTIIRFLLQANPLKIFIPLGLFLVFLGLMVAALILIFGKEAIVNKITMTVLFISGLQIIMLGLLADLVSNKR